MSVVVSRIPALISAIQTVNLRQASCTHSVIFSPEMSRRSFALGAQTNLTLSPYLLCVH